VPVSGLSTQFSDSGVAAKNPLNTTQKSKNPAAMAKMATKAPLPGNRGPTMTITGAAMKLKTGMSQAHSMLGDHHHWLKADC
jgi:hypothetical protein